MGTRDRSSRESSGRAMLVEQVELHRPLNRLFQRLRIVGLDLIAAIYVPCTAEGFDVYRPSEIPRPVRCGRPVMWPDVPGTLNLGL